MVWSPNIGGGYPFIGAGYDNVIPTPQSDPVNFQLLDTDRDGVLTNRDDPYGPYYPGDEYVDWIGISLYNLNRANGQHRPAPPTTFTDTNPNNVLSLYGGSYPFYPRWVQGTGKPFIFSETGSAVNIDTGRNSVQVPATPELELAVKRSWWTPLFQDSVMQTGDTKLARLKGAVWFEERKIEMDYSDPTIPVIRDYRISYSEVVKKAFKADLAALGDKIAYGGKFDVGCDGTFRVRR
jgi:hypothetical protein